MCKVKINMTRESRMEDTMKIIIEMVNSDSQKTDKSDADSIHTAKEMFNVGAENLLRALHQYQPGD